MSCGQKAWAEKCEEELWDTKLKNFSALSPSKAISLIDDATDTLDRFIVSNPSLTKGQWLMLERLQKALKSLI